MGFQTGLAGLNAATKNLDIIGNNIANANTVGAKASRAEFAALVSSAGSGGTDTGQGIGVAVAAVSQQFTQGSINITGNSLDVAINGGGFFQITTSEGKAAYTRDGQFKLDREGNLVTNQQANLMGYTLDSLGQPTSVTPGKLVVPTGAPIAASVTKSIAAEVNLDARATVATDSATPTPFTKYGTAVTAYDSQGLEVPLNVYFVKVGPDPAAIPAVAKDAWDVFDAASQTAGQTALTQNATIKATNAANKALDIKNTALNAAVPPPTTPLPTYANGGIPANQPLKASGSLFRMEFGADGTLVRMIKPAVVTGTGLAAVTTPEVVLPLDKQAITLTSKNSAIGSFSALLDLTKTTQFGSSFQVTKLTQDGYTAGDLTGVSIDQTGVLETKYSNGQTKRLAQLTLADFRNPQGLTPISGGAWVETFASGQPIQGLPTQGKFGELRAGAVEDSNVDLTAELVAMMTAQRSYQANVQTIKTQDQAVQALVNLR